MKFKNLFIIFLLSVFGSLNAQTPTLIASGTYKASGSGASGKPTVSINIPAGKNRLMIIASFTERIHSPVYASNYAVSPDGDNQDYSLKAEVNGVTSKTQTSPWSTFYHGGDNTNVSASTSNPVEYISEAMGLPTGNTTVSFPTLNTPENAGDEIIVQIAIFENATANLSVIDWVNVRDFSNASNITTLSGTAPAIPVGNTLANIVFFGTGGITQQKEVLFSNGWTTIESDVVNNTAGNSNYNIYANEHDGIGLKTAYRTLSSGTPSFTLRRSSGNAETMTLSASLISILPFARPAVTGTVYRDNNGLSGGINSGGTGGGVWNTANALWVNAIDASNNVLATALVSASGVFSIPEGILVEGDTITFQLSENEGTVGQPAPIKELPIGWETIGESTTSGPSDGTPNGEFILTIGTSNTSNNSTNRFGVTACLAGITAPLVQNISITCPATFVNLNTAHVGTVPTGASLVWFNNNTHSGTEITEATAGTYYAFYYDAVNDCYSPVSTPVFVIGYDSLDSDGDGIPDACDLDDDNDGILDTSECTTTVNDFITAFGTGTTTDILPSDFGLALNVKNQNVTADLSAKFGYLANSGAVIVNITNASVHPTVDIWWTKNGEQPSNWEITGTMSAFLAMGNDLLYYANDSKTIHIYDNADVIPVTVPGLANQTAAAGQWSIIDTPTQKTLNNLNTNSGNVENGNWRYINLNLGPKSFGFSTTVAFADPNYAVTVLLECDTDKDGIPDRLDLDSDGDGCPDAIEGAANFDGRNLENSSMYGGNSGSAYIGTSTLAITQNLGNTIGDTPTTIGVPTIAGTGQTIGSSNNPDITGCFCYKPAVIDTGNTYPSLHGITSLSRSGTQYNSWLTSRESSWTVLESKTKGFVINRVKFNTSNQPVADNGITLVITSPVEGMMVYDTTNNCLKLYTSIDNGTTFSWHCLTTQTCPD